MSLTVRISLSVVMSRFAHPTLQSGVGRRVAGWPSAGASLISVAAPDYVPTRPTDRPRRYESPPRRGNSWSPDRPADLLEGQPAGERLGSQGPDQGYALTLVHQFEGKLPEDRAELYKKCVELLLNTWQAPKDQDLGQKMGWASRAFEPHRRIRSVVSISSYEEVPPPAPNTVARPTTEGACQVRLQLSTLCEPITTLVNFCAR